MPPTMAYGMRQRGCSRVAELVPPRHCRAHASGWVPWKRRGFLGIAPGPSGVGILLPYLCQLSTAAASLDFPAFLPGVPSSRLVYVQGACEWWCRACIPCLTGGIYEREHLSQSTTFDHVVADLRGCANLSHAPLLWRCKHLHFALAQLLHALPYGTGIAESAMARTPAASIVAAIDSFLSERGWY
ncbi:hypothetical protein GQ53DRAFT_464488 [Thozetella sp. PMI_491]|nr:hypothetical protein GQ53DRAFT_464488 [Thozetella sp. PMI_491]